MLLLLVLSMMVQLLHVILLLLLSVMVLLLHVMM